MKIYSLLNISGRGCFYLGIDTFAVLWYTTLSNNKKGEQNEQNLYG